MATTAATMLVGCGPEVHLSQFMLDTPITGRVIENGAACVVDAMCFLRLEFADTTVQAVYGTGERPAPTCTIPPEASDAAFAVEQGDIIETVLTDCPGEGYFLQALQTGGSEPDS